MPWTATITYRPALGAWTDLICAENIHEYYGGKDSAVPRAHKPDFESGPLAPDPGSLTPGLCLPPLLAGPQKLYCHLRRSLPRSSNRMCRSPVVSPGAVGLPAV